MRSPGARVQRRGGEAERHPRASPGFPRFGGAWIRAAPVQGWVKKKQNKMINK